MTHHNFTIYSDSIFTLEVAAKYSLRDDSYSHPFGTFSDVGLGDYEITSAWIWVGDHGEPIEIPKEQVKKDQYLIDNLEELLEEHI